MATKFVLPFRNPAIWELMGIEVIEMKDGHATLIMPFHEKLTQPYGIVHGGALFTLADSAAAVAIASVVNPRENRLLTIEMKMNFLASVSEGTMEARAKIIKKGKKIAPVDIDVLNNEILVAKAIATYIILENEKKS